MALAVGADSKGNIYEVPDLEMAGLWWDRLLRVRERELIPLPPGSRLFVMPGDDIVGWDAASGEFAARAGIVRVGQRTRLRPVAAFLAPAYTRTHLPAVRYRRGRRRILPLWSYTAVGWSGGQFVTAGLRTDRSRQWDPDRFDDHGLPERVAERVGRSPGNRLLAHLARCAMDYHCFAAKNLFLGRWEAPLPVAPRCNAGCIGCLSLQRRGGCQASHERIGFLPTAEEVADVAVGHLERAPRAIASFGQGCEGDPILEDVLIARSLALIRSRTGRGTVHLNTNGSRPGVIKKLARAGLDSIRVSLSSTHPERYRRYTRPRGFGLPEVVRTIRESKRCGLYVSLNLLVFPGLTDREDEVEALVKLIEDTGLDMVQMRNLAIDPAFYIEKMGRSGMAAGVGVRPPGRVGVREMIRLLRREFPRLRVGYFNVPCSAFRRT